MITIKILKNCKKLLIIKFVKKTLKNKFFIINYLDKESCIFLNDNYIIDSVNHNFYEIKINLNNIPKIIEDKVIIKILFKEENEKKILLF